MECLISFFFVAFLASISAIFLGFPLEIGLLIAVILGIIATFGGEKVFYHIVRSMRFVK
jgi:hypothetical protein